MEENDTLLKLPMKSSANGDCAESTEENSEAEKVPNVKHDTDEEDDDTCNAANDETVSLAITIEDYEETVLPDNEVSISEEKQGQKFRDGVTQTHDKMDEISLDGNIGNVCDIPAAVTIPLTGDSDSNINNGILSTNNLSRRESRTSCTTINLDVCRICHCESEPGAPLISPCICAGSLKFVHQSCLQQWIKSADTKSCELCKYDFSMTTKIKPFRKWQKLEMTTVERRKIMCSVTFHIIAITCVIWSLYVLIDKTTQEIRLGLLEWPFWTKLIVVAIGFTGGLVFMYVQCKMYVQLCRRWRAYNRVIYIQNLPDGNTHKIPLQPVYTQSKLQSSNNQTSLFSDADLL